MTNRAQLVMANWKQHGSEALFCAWIREVSRLDLPHLERVLCVPLPYLALLRQLQQHNPLRPAAQVVSAFSGGAYTGEVSAAMLREFEVAYCLVGHSERRSFFQESAALRRGQLNNLWQQGITPVLCIGETLSQHQQGFTAEVLFQQLAEVLNDQPEPGPLIVAYEPVYAIGSGIALSAPAAQQIHQQLRLMLRHWYSPQACEQLPIIYGGSVSSHNAGTFMQQADIDGVLVGSSSLQAESFNLLCQAITAVAV